jgi:phage shock protein C
MMEQSTPRRLYRSRSDRVLAGVCGGMAHYVGIDPVLIRLAFVVFTLMTGVGFIAYIILAIVIPEYPVGEVEPQVTSVATPNHRGSEIVGYVLVGVGALILASNLGLFRLIQWNFVGPLVLIGIGLLILVSRFRR